MNDYHFICKTEDLEDSKGQRFYINDTDIAVFKVEKKVYVLGNVCPHQNSPAIYDGFIHEGCVICPLHGWKFNLSDGRKDSGNRGLESYDTKILNGKIYAKVYPKRLNW